VVNIKHSNIVELFKITRVCYFLKQLKLSQVGSITFSLYTVQYFSMW